MKPLHVLLFALAGACISCGEKEKPDPAANAVLPADPDVLAKDVPLLPVKGGDEWRYAVAVEMSAPEGAGEMLPLAKRTEKVRRYLGQISPGAELPEVGVFEVTIPELPVEREFVEIHDDRIFLRGSQVMREGSAPMWFETPVPFVMAGVRAGLELPELRDPEGIRSRRIQVVGRDDITVPAGAFDAIRLLMTGTDGEVELRRTIWFAPGTGIIREELKRYSGERLLYTETQELVETSVAPRSR